MKLFPSLQTLSEYFHVLAFKSPIRRIEPYEKNISMSFSSSSNNSTLKYGELHAWRYIKATRIDIFDGFGIVFVNLEP